MKKITDYRWLSIIPFIVIVPPYAIIAFCKDKPYQSIAHVFALIPFNILAPLCFLAIIFIFEMAKNKLGAIFLTISYVIFSGFMIIFLTVPFSKSFIHLIKNDFQFETKVGMVRSFTDGSSRAALSNSQNFYLEGSEENFYSMYRFTRVRKGDWVQVEIMPDINYVVSLEILRRADD